MMLQKIIRLVSDSIIHGGALFAIETFFQKNVNNYSKAWSKAHKIVILKSTFLSSAMICWTQYANLFFSDNATENYQIGLEFNNSWRSTFCKCQFYSKLVAYFSFSYGAKSYYWVLEVGSRIEGIVFRFVIIVDIFNMTVNFRYLLCF